MGQIGTAPYNKPEPPIPPRKLETPMHSLSAKFAVIPWRAARYALAAVVAFGLLSAPFGTAWAGDPSAREAKAPEAPQATELDDAAEPLVPLKPRAWHEKDHIRALALFAAGRVAEQKQEYESALRNYERAYRFDPAAVAALREVVPLAFNLDRQSEGVRYALILAERDPSDHALLRRLAIYLTENGDNQRALSLYEKALALEEGKGDKPSSNTVLAWMEMARLYFVSKKFDNAARYFSKVAAALNSPKEYQLTPAIEKGLLNKGELTWQLIGESFLAAGRSDEALTAFEKAHKFKADEALYLYNLARVEAKKKQPAQALAKLEAYLGAHHASQGTGPYELLAELLSELGQEGQLNDRLEKHRSQDPKNVPLAYFLAERYRKAGSLDKAEPIYNSLIDERKERPPLEAIIGLVDIHRQQKDAAKLLKVLGESAGRAGSLDALGDAGKALAADAETARATVTEAQKRLAADPAQLDSGARLAAALVALELKDFAAADELFEAALAGDGAKRPEVLINWGLQLFMANQYDRAVQVFERGLNEKILPSDNPAIYFYLAGALEMGGKTEAALERARQAAELEKDNPRYASRAPWIQFHAKQYDAARHGYLALLEKFDKKYDSDEVRDALRDARLVLSNICVFQNDLPQAEEWLEQVLDEFPEDEGALNDLGYLWADADKHLERAHEMIRTAVAADPKNMAYRDSLGWVLFRLGRYPEAVAELQVAAGASEPDGVVLDHLGESQLKNGQKDEAFASWRRAIEAFEKASDSDKAAKVREKITHAESQAPSAAAPAPVPAQSKPSK
jgi:tetratricopeptide (TPR) repeat protein